jgi:cell division protein FtsX
LLLARAAGRSVETGIRLALGASPWRLLRQWLTESLLVALLAAGAGLLVAQWLMALFAGSHVGRLSKSVAGNALVVAQIALSLALLVGAGLLTRSLWNLRNDETGYQTDRVLLAQFDLDPREFTAEKGLNFYQRLLDRARALPGVEMASLTKNVPINPLRMKKPRWPPRELSRSEKKIG